ncbi:MAG: hypothetical protein QOG43_1580 [Actinomycetota bacterium]|nr:hypothetical protein [Actinomycetota bacterium]
MAASSNEDRVLPATRALSIFIIPFLVVGFTVLFFWPADTKRLFAWTINPPLTAMILGSVYLGGAWFFLQAARATSWRAIKGGFVPVGTFASIQGLNTILHWEKFNHGHVAFWLWAGLYFTTPFLVFGVWLANRRVGDTFPPPARRPVSSPAAAAIGLTGLAATAMGLFLFLAPTRAIDGWPWMLTPLTARVMGAIFCLGVAGVGIRFDRDWQAVRIPLQVAMVMLVLILVSVLRGRDDLDTSKAFTWVLVSGFAAVLLGSAALYRRMSAAHPAGPSGHERAPAVHEGEAQ